MARVGQTMRPPQATEFKGAENWATKRTLKMKIFIFSAQKLKINLLRQAKENLINSCYF
jgi:hypothetical protein